MTGRRDLRHRWAAALLEGAAPVRQGTTTWGNHREIRRRRAIEIRRRDFTPVQTVRAMWPCFVALHHEIDIRPQTAHGTFAVMTGTSREVD